jgi:hypothetical protein
MAGRVSALTRAAARTALGRVCRVLRVPPGYASGGRISAYIAAPDSRYFVLDSYESREVQSGR